MFQLFKYSSSTKLFIITYKLDNFFLNLIFMGFFFNSTTEKRSWEEYYTMVTEEADRKFGLGMHRKFLCVSEHGVMESERSNRRKISICLAQEMRMYLGVGNSTTGPTFRSSAHIPRTTAEQGKILETPGNPSRFTVLNSVTRRACGLELN